MSNLISIDGGTAGACNYARAINVACPVSAPNGYTTYAWTFVSYPEGSAPTFTDPAIRNPSFTPTAGYEGRAWAIMCVVDAGLPSEDSDIVIVGVPHPTLGWIIPPFGMTKANSDVAEGWANKVWGLTKILADTMAGIATPASSVIWRWNETDVTQFTIAMDEVAPGTTVVSRVVGDDGPRVRVAFPTKVSGQQAFILTINDLVMPAVSDERRYVLKFRLVGFNPAKTPGEWYSVGVALMCNDGVGATFYGQACTAQFGTADRSMQVAAGVKTLAGSTPGWGNGIATLISGGNDNALCVDFSAEVTQRHVSGTDPNWRAGLDVKIPGDAALMRYKFASRKAVTAATGALAAAFQTEDFDRCGIAILGEGGTQTDHYFEFDSIRVEMHPMDKP